MFIQHAQSQQRTSELAIHANKIEQDKLKSHIRTLEIERAALLTTVATMKRLLPHDALARLNLNLSHLPAAMAENIVLSPPEPQDLNSSDSNWSVSDIHKEKACEDKTTILSPGGDINTSSRSSPVAVERAASPSAAAKSLPSRQSPGVHQPNVKKSKNRKEEAQGMEGPANLSGELEYKSLSLSNSEDALSASHSSPQGKATASVLSPSIPSQQIAEGDSSNTSKLSSPTSTSSKELN